VYGQKKSDRTVGGKEKRRTKKERTGAPVQGGVEIKDRKQRQGDEARVEAGVGDKEGRTKGEGGTEGGGGEWGGEVGRRGDKGREER